MTQTHRGFGSLGAPTGRSPQFRAIADCAARGSQIYEEWLVVDQAAAALQAGLTPATLAEAWPWPWPTTRPGRARLHLAFSEGRTGPDTREQQDDSAARLVRDLQAAFWSSRDLSALRHGYDRAVNLHLPAGVDATGRSLTGGSCSATSRASRTRPSPSTIASPGAIPAGRCASPRAGR